MLSLNIMLSMLMLISTLLALFMAWKNHQRFKLNTVVADELDAILHSALRTIEKKNKAIGSGAHQIRKNYTEGAPEDINTPEMLSTLLTVLIHKYGMAKLSLEDFKGVPRDDFVSIYIDTQTNELVLSLNQNLQEADASGTLVGFTPACDDTFH